MPRRTAKTMRRRVKSASKKMVQSVRMRRGAPAKKNVPKKNVPKKKTQKGPGDWRKQVMVVFKEMRQKNPNVQLQDAMKEASRRKNKGILSPVQSARSSEFSTVSAPKKKKALSPVSNAPSSEFSDVPHPKPKKKAEKKAEGVKQKALSDPGPRPASRSAKDRGYNSEGASKFFVGPYDAPNPNWQEAKKQKAKKQKAKKTKKKKMTPPPIPPNKKGKKIPSKKGKKSSKKKQAPKWATYYGKDGTEKPFLNPEYSSPKTFGSATE